MQTIPIFPLNLVLFPGAHLPLRIFEPRYTDLVSECLRTNSGFGVCYIKEGKEVGANARCHTVGTHARIVDWNRLEDGLLGIAVEADKRFKVERFSRRANTLLEGEIHWLEEIDITEGVGEEYRVLQELMNRVLAHYEITYEEQAEMLDDPTWLAYRLAEYLPLDPQLKQALLEMNNSQQRLTRLQQVIGESQELMIEN